MDQNNQETKLPERWTRESQEVVEKYASELSNVGQVTNVYRIRALTREEKIEQDIMEWTEKGHTMLPEDKWEQWDSFVVRNMNNIFKDLPLEAVLQVQEILSSGSKEAIAEACEYMDDYYKEARISINAAVKRFCDHGPEAVQYFMDPNRKPSNREITTKEDTTDISKKLVLSDLGDSIVVEFADGSTKTYQESHAIVGSLDKCVEYLLQCKEAGEQIVFNFNGHNLYSDTVTMDSAYLEVVGQTKADFDKAREEWRNERAAEEARIERELEVKIPEWKEKGREMFWEDKWELWDEAVEIRANDLYHGRELDCVLKVQELLTSGSKEEGFVKAMEYMNEQGHSGTSWAITCSLIKEFCDKGEDFVQYLDDRDKSDMLGEIDDVGNIDNIDHGDN